MASTIATVATGAAAKNVAHGSQAEAPGARPTVYRSSLPMNPTEGGTPAIETDAATAAANVTGMAVLRPPSSVRSRVPVDFSMVPATMNRAAL